MTAPPRHAVSYIRFSTKGQITGDSLTRQLDKARAYASKHNLQLDESSYRDLGISAFKGKNATEGALAAFLKAVDDGTIPSDVTLLIESFDRLSRAKPQDAFALFQSITKRGVTIVTLTDEQAYSSETIDANWTKLIIGLTYMARAHEESAIKAVRCKSGIAKRLDNGFKVSKCPAWLKPTADKRGFTLVEKHANIVREVFELRAQSIGALKIAHHVNETYGWKYGSPQVVRLLNNPSVIGTRVSQAGHAPRLDYYPAVVSKALFYEVQRLMTSPNLGTRRGRRPDDEPNLFTGLVRCASCGSALRFFRANKNVGYRYLKCHTALNRAGCDAGFVNYDALEKEVIGWLLLDQDDESIPLIEKKPTRKAEADAELLSLREQESNLIVMASRVMNAQPVLQRLDAVQLQIRDYEATMVIEPAVDDDRLFAEKAWALAERHDDALLAVADGEDPEQLYEVRRELKTAFQRGLERINVYPDARDGDLVKCQFSLQFRGYDGLPERTYTRPALNNVRGKMNGH